ncbi:hypothetical protein [Pyrococcus abyssi]|uniref:DUF304 domain-containing protein n=1 Tax=Pyrococcus abyssi (strain GE5 / Orsay) TaxID=272844 RepID=Q9V0J9_PYRAB|nr:hypothetical protein [Pyrococcus abyssi]CAB49704.1 Hypothetical protein PAB0535 [Pyrococcus abyssi GE5]CCE70189.1 TPA: hypothetical protein PAB0535 [Pyrococcus abyssi GE5]
MLYEESVSSKLLNLVLLVTLLPIIILAVYLRNQPYALKILAIEGIIVSIIVLEASAIRILIDDDGIRIRGRLGLFLRKTIRLEEIEWYSVSHGWMSCQYRSLILHFSIPAKGCVLIKRKKGMNVSFSTNNPEEVSKVLSMLGIPKVPYNKVF